MEGDTVRDQSPLEQKRALVRQAYLADEALAVSALIGASTLTDQDRASISAAATQLINDVRSTSRPGLMEEFLGEYGLSSQEGIALMCLAEAMLRVPDAATVDELIRDKITPAEWGRHLGRSSSSLVNASTWGLLITGKLLAPARGQGVGETLRMLVQRVGEPVVREAVGAAMRQMGKQFVLGRTIQEAQAEGADSRKNGYRYSYDMLGEAARTDGDAERYLAAYRDAIEAITPYCTAPHVRDNPGISVKLSALHPRYEVIKHDRVMTELVPRARSLAVLAAKAGMGFNIDAEEADRLDISLDIIAALLADTDLDGWDGFGVVVQAYGPRAYAVLDWLYELADKYNRRIMVRLVKGAYWDTEIKRAQTLGLSGFPVFTRKVNTDISYIVCAEKLMRMTDRIYPQFATHNAHSVSTIMHLARGMEDRFEFQRLHGMGHALHDQILETTRFRSRIYAPVGSHKDLLAYLVRRLLENGANSSFVNQIVDLTIPAEQIAACPFERARQSCQTGANPRITTPRDIFAPSRINSEGFDWTDPVTLAHLQRNFTPHLTAQWQATPTTTGIDMSALERAQILNPARLQECVGSALLADAAVVDLAIAQAAQAAPAWGDRLAEERAQILERTADLYEQNGAELMVLAQREAGKTLPDAIAELREAVDFLRYYADRARHQEGGIDRIARGVFACISPWNFPLAIFTGQIAAALVTGNCVLAKPAEQAPLIAARAVALMHQAGVPAGVLHLLPGDGPKVGGPLSADPRIDGICFTGSTETAQRINRSMAFDARPKAPLIAETGGLNAMIVDSTALPEQTISDVIASSFQSAGQRCSALRMLYVQDDIAADFTEMLIGAMNELEIGDPLDLSIDIGPVIDRDAQAMITDYVAAAEADGRVLNRLDPPEEGTFAPAALIQVGGIEDLEAEIFGPVLHIATFKADELDQVINNINATGFGLTFGLHSRIDDRVQYIVERMHVGNIYVNRNQIGAIVGSQPFGGENLSGTGPKAGGPFYLPRFTQTAMPTPRVDSAPAAGDTASRLEAADVQPLIDAVDNAEWLAEADPIDLLREISGAPGTSAAHILDEAASIRNWRQNLPGPTGESNRMSLFPRGTILCLGTDFAGTEAHVLQALALGNGVVAVCPYGDRLFAPLVEAGLPIRAVNGHLQPDALTLLKNLDAVSWAGPLAHLSALRRALAAREGKIMPLIGEYFAPTRFVTERHLCIDTTASGGNASLLAAADS